MERQPEQDIGVYISVIYSDISLGVYISVIYSDISLGVYISVIYSEISLGVYIEDSFCSKETATARRQRQRLWLAEALLERNFLLRIRTNENLN